MGVSLRRLALLSVLFFASLTGYTLWALIDLQDELSADVGENMVWAVGQATYQAGLLKFAALAPGVDAGHHGNVALQRQLMRGRMAVLLAPTQAEFMRRAGVLEQLRAVSALLASPKPDYPQMQLTLYEVGKRVMQAEREFAGERRDTYKRLMRHLIIFVFGVMASGVALCWQLFRSMTRTREAHDEVARQHAHARELLDALEHERSARLRYRDFVSVMSHQLRTPLAVIDSSAQRLVRQDTAVDRDRQVLERSERIRRSVRQLNQLISRVLQGLRVDDQLRSQTIALDLALCDWAQIIRQALDSFGEMLAERTVNVRWKDDRSPPLWVRCDRLWCMEILANLISNADKYSPPGTEIDIQVEVADGLLHCSVCDCGPGIAPDDLQHLFERFFRGSHGQKQPGVGLGLSIARTLAQWHSGDLSLVASGEEGSVFTLSLPLDGPACHEI